MDQDIQNLIYTDIFILMNEHNLAQLYTEFSMVQYITELL
jgi:hypothetical protein